LYYHLEQAKIQLAEKIGHETEGRERFVTAPAGFHSDIEEFLPRAEAKLKAIKRDSHGKAN
jgi:hypothetical protein